MQSSGSNLSGDCVEARKRISLQLDGELEARDAVLLEAHLAVCGECHRHLGELAALVEELRSAPLVLPTLDTRVPRRLAYLRVSAVSAAAAAAAAAAVAVAVLSLAVGQAADSKRVALPGSVIYQQLTLKERQMSELTAASAPSNERPPDAPRGLDPSIGA